MSLTEFWIVSKHPILLVTIDARMDQSVNWFSCAREQNNGMYCRPMRSLTTSDRLATPGGVLGLDRRARLLQALGPTHLRGTLPSRISK
jgi:hypothetical protein